MNQPAVLCRVLVMPFLLYMLTLASQLPDNGFRRCGHQGAFVNHTLWLDGGHEVTLNNSGSFVARNLTQVGLFTKFSIPDTFASTPLPKPPEVPNVSYGTLWSNEIDTFWQYGGQYLADNETVNTIWRFTLDPNLMNVGTWSQLDPRAANLSRTRTTKGAGCNVPSRLTGYYLGGQSTLKTTGPIIPQYFHSMTIFDMSLETTTIIDVPDFVPIIGQSLVYLDVSADGILVAMGGQTEINGVLNTTSLAEVYIYDIASGTWIVQQTTDVLGNSNKFYSVYNEYEPGLPNPRYHMCVVAGTAPDHTSYNVYVFGGQNETDTPGDIWALSLPSAVWIRMNTTDVFNNPKRASSCNLINSRYVIMADGCWGATNDTCYSYGWNPLLYDIAKGDWSWTFDPTVEGYFIPEQIYNIIGGSSDGSASHSKPMYTSFGDPLMTTIFAFPSDLWATRSLLALKLLLPIFLVFGLSLWAISEIGHYYGKIVQFKSPRLNQSGSEGNWKPWAMQLPFLCMVLFATIVLMVAVPMLWYISSVTDPNPSHWNGGLESEGTWSDQQYTSAFTSAPGERRPSRGLVSFYLDTSISGTWDRKNASQRLGVVEYILWTYIPSVVAVLYGALWAIVDGEIRRVEKYHQLAGPTGSLGKSSICLDYHCFWSPLAILQALHFRQWAVAASSTGYVLALIAVPNIQNYVFNWVVYAGGNLNWGGVYTWQVGTVDPYWAKILLTVLSIHLACIICLIVFVQRRKSGLHEDPRGIISWVRLTLDCGDVLVPRLDNDDSFATLRTVFSKMNDEIFCVTETQQLRVLRDQSRPSQHRFQTMWTTLVPQQIRTALGNIWALCELVWKFVLYIADLVDSWVSDYPKSFMFHPLIIVPWIACLILVLCANIYILAKMTSTTQMTLSNYALPWSPDVYLLVGVFIQSIYQVFDRNIRAITVLNALRQGYQHPEILWDDFTSGDPVVEIFQAFHKQQHLLGYVMLGSVATLLYTIMLGSLQVSASFYGATDFVGDLSGVIVTFIMNLFILVVSIAGAWTYGRAPILPRYPGTVASLLPYILSSERLKEDYKEVKDEIDKKAQIKVLKEKCRRYGFGVFCNESSPDVRHLGIERNYNYGPEGKEHVRPWKRDDGT